MSKEVLKAILVEWIDIHMEDARSAGSSVLNSKRKLYVDKHYASEFTLKEAEEEYSKALQAVLSLSYMLKSIERFQSVFDIEISAEYQKKFIKLNKEETK